MQLPEVEPEIKAYPGFVCTNGIYDPWFMLFELFAQYTLDDMRGKLWDLYKAAIKDDAAYPYAQQKDDLVFFYERMNDLATAAYVIAREKWAESPEYYTFDEDYKNAEAFQQRVREFEALQTKRRSHTPNPAPYSHT